MSTATSPRFTIAGGLRPVPIEIIIGEVCAEMGIWPSELQPPGRMPNVVIARAVVTALAREYTLHSYGTIAEAMGLPNHSTLIDAHKRLKHKLTEEEGLPPDRRPYTLAYAACWARVSKIAVSQS